MYHYIISKFEYFTLLALGAYSVFQIGKDTGLLVYGTLRKGIQKHLATGETEEWSVVAGDGKGDSKPSPSAFESMTVGQLKSVIADMKVKDVLGEVHAALLDEKKKVAKLLFDLLLASIKAVFGIVYIASLMNIYHEHNSICHERGQRFQDVATAYERITEADERTRSLWAEQSQHVNTVGFVYRYFCINVACMIGWLFVMKRVQKFSSFTVALQRDRKTRVLALWSLFSSLVFVSMLHQVYAESGNPFDILELSPLATAKEIKRSFRKLSMTYHPDFPTC